MCHLFWLDECLCARHTGLMMCRGCKAVFSYMEPGWCVESKCHARLHRNAALMGLCYIAKSTRAVKRLPANLYDPLTTRHRFAAIALVPADWNCCQDSFTEVCRIPPILTSWLHTCCFLISRGSVRSSLVEMVCGMKVNAVWTVY